MWFMFVIPFVIFFVIFLMIGKSFMKAHKNVDKTMDDMVATISAYAKEHMANEVDESQSVEPVIQDKTCEYCGSTIPAGSTKCGSCGAKVKK